MLPNHNFFCYLRTQSDYNIWLIKKTWSLKLYCQTQIKPKHDSPDQDYLSKEHYNRKKWNKSEAIGIHYLVCKENEHKEIKKQ